MTCLHLFCHVRATFFSRKSWMKLYSFTPTENFSNAFTWNLSLDCTFCFILQSGRKTFPIYLVFVQRLALPRFLVFFYTTFVPHNFFWHNRADTFLFTTHFSFVFMPFLLNNFIFENGSPDTPICAYMCFAELLPRNHFHWVHCLVLVSFLLPFTIHFGLNTVNFQPYHHIFYFSTHLYYMFQTFSLLFELIWLRNNPNKDISYIVIYLNI